MAGIKEAPREISETVQDAVSHPVEAPSSPERPRLILLKTPVIPGASNTGKDEVTRILYQRHCWPVFDGSSTGFERRGKGPERGHMRRTRKEHRRFDYQQGLTFDNLTSESEHQLHQTRLGGVILAERKDIRSRLIGKAIRKNEWNIQWGKPLINVPPEIPAVSILLWARKEVRVQRAYNQTMKAYEDQQLKLAAGEVVSEGELVEKPTVDSIDAQMEDRQKKDVLDWAPGHRDYIHEGENPFSRTLKRKNGGPVYDFWIDTSDITPEEVADRIEDILLTNGGARHLSFAELDAISRKNKKNEQPSEGLPPGGDVFISLEPTGNGSINEEQEDTASSGMDKGEPITRQTDRHPNHPSRRRQGQEIVA